MMPDTDKGKGGNREGGEMPPPVVLVTGGAGYIGSHVCKALSRRGWLPVTCDSLVTGHRDAVRWGPLEVTDIRDGAALDAILARYRPVAVMHFAASAYVGESVARPALYYDNNVTGSLTLLGAMRRAGIGTIVFSSSCAVYGEVGDTPVSEQTPCVPRSPYGRSKLMVEHILEDYQQAYGLRFAALRYFNAAGADAEGEAGERHDPETHLIPRALMAAGGRLPHLDIFGDDYPTADGTCLRDFIHVSDLAEGHILALEYLLEKKTSLQLNLGTGQAVSIRDVVQTVHDVTGRPVPVVFSPRRPGDPAAVCADPGRAREVLGFSTRYHDLGQIVQTAWDFMNRP